MTHEFDESKPRAISDQLAIAAAFPAILEQVYIDVDLPELLPAFPSVLEQMHSEHPEIEVRPYQIDCLNALQQARDEGRQVALVQMATGLGKTTVVAADVKRFLQDKPDSRILFLCHQKDILRQARKRFESVVGESYTYGEYHGDQKDEMPVTCLFSSFQTMRDAKESFKPEEFDYVVVDEGHHGKASTYEPTLKYFTPSFLLGITATPNRSDLKDIRDIFGQEIYSKTLPEALVEGLLAYPDYRVISDDIEEGLLKDESISLADFNRKVFIPKRDKEIAHIINTHRTRVENPKMMIFCASVEHAERMAELIDGSQPLHSKMTLGKRESALQEFLEGDDRAVVSVNLFNEGVDIANTNILVFLRSTESETVFLQQLGRGLRRTPMKGSVLVLDFVANLDRLLMIEKFLEEVLLKKQIQVKAKRPCDNIGDGGVDDGLFDLDFKDISENTETLRELQVGSFYFSESTRKLFEIIKERRQRLREIEDAPKGYVSVRRFSEESGLSRDLLYRIIGESGLALKKYRFGRRPGDSLSPSQVETILAHPDVKIPKVPDDYISVDRAANKLEASPVTVRKRIKEFGWELPKFKLYSTLVSALSEEQFHQLEAIFSKRAKLADKMISINIASQRLGVSRKKMAKTIEELGLTLERRRFGPTEADAMTEEQYTFLASQPGFATPKAPDDWVSVHQVAVQLHVSDITLTSIIEELSIDTANYKFGSVVGLAVPRAAVTILETHRKVMLDAPEGWIAITPAAKKLHTSVPVLERIIKESGIALSDEYRFGLHRRLAFNPDQFNFVKAKLSEIRIGKRRIQW